jgi:hypothetical protein
MCSNCLCQALCQALRQALRQACCCEQAILRRPLSVCESGLLLPEYQAKSYRHAMADGG